ncbi:MAG TPA: winged helix-turn-helix domain-containing protein [Candidatus Sulfotelmatobacter sp.]|nr:winged helix-turn-helix domain-containing protein [Candidatus Sulfotelmatobacter sp.]
MSDANPNLVYACEQWEIDLGRRELRSRGIPVPLGGRAFEIVTVLVQSASELVTKDDLMERVWPGAIVGEATIHVHIAAVRKALGADRGLLKTASGRGYRLLGSWTPVPREAAAAPIASPATRATETPPPNNFPPVITRLVGRSAAAQVVRDLVSAYRVVTLTGPGGIGKTSLAIKAVRYLLPAFEDGGWLVELASLSDPDLVPSTVAGVLGLRLDGEISAEGVARAVATKHLLLLLDNCEHVIDAVANLAETLVRLCPRSTIVATSREMLRIDGEAVYRVPPLDVPAVGHHEPDHILGHSAVELFIARTKALDASFSLRAENAASIGEICRRLDGIPLAIEFAAAHAAVLGVRQLTADLRDRFALLVRGRRTALPRHRTLRAVLDWSHELLPEAERLLLRRLSVFPAGFTVGAAAAVMTDTGLDAAAVADGMANLVSKSLVMRDESEAGTRWYLLETTRAYALEKLGDSGEAQYVARRQAEFCLALFAPFGTEGQLQAAIDDLERYRVEVDNLRAALNWAFSNDGDASLGVALAAVAADFWAAASLMPEACAWADKALAQIGDAGTRHGMVLQYSFGITGLLTRGMNDDARKALTQALTLAREFSDFDYQQRATHGLWLFLYRTSALDDAVVLAHQFEEVRGFGDPQSRAVVDCWLGMTQIYRAAHIEAIERARRVIDHYPIESRGRDTLRFAGDMPAIFAGQIAVSWLSRGLLDTALQWALKAVEQAGVVKHAYDQRRPAAWAAGYVFLSLGELEIADRYGNETINYASIRGWKPFHATGICVRGSLAVKRGDPGAGVDLLRRGLAEMRETRYQLYYPSFLVELAMALGALGHIDDGLAEIDNALRFAAQTGNRCFLPETFRVKGELSALRDPDDLAVEDSFNRGVELAREQDALFWELRLAVSLARLRVNQKRPREAAQILAPVHGRFTEGFEMADLRAAKALLDALTP